VVAGSSTGTCPGHRRNTGCVRIERLGDGSCKHGRTRGQQRGSGSGAIRQCDGSSRQSSTSLAAARSATDIEHAAGALYELQERINGALEVQWRARFGELNNAACCSIRTAQRRLGSNSMQLSCRSPPEGRCP
jgi:hypothetical protein